jgi:hypothetical protein
MKETNEKILNYLMKTAFESGAGEDSPYMKLLHIIMDMEYRIKALEVKPDPIPIAMFSGFPHVMPEKNFLSINERREEIGFPPIEVSKELNENERSIYNHLVSKGCSWKEAADIVKEIEEIGNGG